MSLRVGVAAGALTLPRFRDPGRSGNPATACFDEDAVTLASAAAMSALDQAGRPAAALILATVSAPAAEGGAAQVVAELCGISGAGLHVAEHGGTIAAGGSALLAGMALVAAGIGPALVVAADARRDERMRAYGDGAAALLLDVPGEAGEITFLGSAGEAFADRWREPGSPSVRRGDDSLLKCAPGRDHAAALGLPSTVRILDVTSAPVPRAGHLGCASLAAALLLGADRDEQILISAGGVSHAFSFRPGPAAAATVAAAQTALAAGSDAAPPVARSVAGFDPYASQSRSWRERRQDLRLEGVRCGRCGQVLFPAPPACPDDGPGTALAPCRLGRTGTVLTFTRDHIFPLGAPLSMAVAEMDGGGRFYGQVADGATVAIGDRVRLIPRLLHEGGGRAQYFWKFVPDTEAG